MLKMMRRLRKNGSRAAPIVLGAYVNALGLVRALGEDGLVSIVVSDRPDLAFDSRHAIPLLAANPRTSPDAFRDDLLRLAADLPHGGVLFATSDEHLQALAQVRDRLEAAGVKLPMSGQAALEVFASKRKTHALARELGLAIPVSADVTGADLTAAASNLHFPVILKPEETIGFQAALNISRQTIFLESADLLDALQVQLVAAGLGERTFVLQEYIPGSSERLYTISTFSDRNGRIHAYSTGYKVRQHPPEAGTISQGYVTPTPELLEPTARLFEAVSFFGIANTEYKFDERDGLYKLIEVNPRPGKWNSSATGTGVNLPLIAYRYAVNGSLPPDMVVSKETALWTEGLGLALSYQSEFGIVRAARAFLAGNDLPGKRIAAILEWTDPLPAFRAFWHAVRLAARFARSALLGRR